MSGKRTKIAPTATHWGNFRVEHCGGELIAIHPYDVDRQSPDMRQNLLAALDPDVRVAQPMVRRSYLEDPRNNKPHLRGTDPYIPVDWEQAIELAALAICRARDEYGCESIFGGSYGWSSAGRFHHAQSQVHRFLNLVGGYTTSVNTYSLAAGEVIIPHVLGMSAFSIIAEPPPAEDIARHCRTMVLFGGVPLKNSQICPGGLHAHDAVRQLKLMRDAGVEFINVSPIRSDVEEFLDAEWLAVRPGTDVALMLGLAHTLFEEGLHDREFLESYCVGWERFLPYLSGTSDHVPKDADWAELICGIQAQQIRALARRLAAGRSFIGVSWSLQRQEHGEQAYWMAAVLAAMLGDIGLPGGGVAYGYGCAHNTGFAGRRRSPFKFAALPQGVNKIDKFIPVSRISEMLENPGASFRYNGQTLRYPEIRLIYWAGGNPFHHHQDLNRMRKAWQLPDSIIVNEPFWTASARHADIIFAANTTLERNDIGGAGDGLSITPMRQVAQSFGQSRSDHEIFARLAARLGFEQEFRSGRTEFEWLKYLYDETRNNALAKGIPLPAFEEFWEGEQIVLAEQIDEVEFELERFRRDPQAHPLGTPSGKIELFSEVIAGFASEDCPGHPSWMEKDEWLGSPRARTYPLHLISNQPRTKLHSQLDHGPFSKSAKVAGREPVRINPQDAQARGVAEGDVVRIFNDRGACLAGAVISEDIRAGVVELATGAWYWTGASTDEKPLELHGNPNVLTPDKGTSSLAQGPTAHSCLVQIERFEGLPPDNNVFNPKPTVIGGIPSPGAIRPADYSWAVLDKSACLTRLYPALSSLSSATEALA